MPVDFDKDHEMLICALAQMYETANARKAQYVLVHGTTSVVIIGTD